MGTGICKFASSTWLRQIWLLMEIQVLCACVRARVRACVGVGVVRARADTLSVKWSCSESMEEVREQKFYKILLFSQ